MAASPQSSPGAAAGRPVLGESFRARWIARVAEQAKANPPSKVKRVAVIVSIARAFLDHGDDDGSEIQVGCLAVAQESFASVATVARVRRWLFETGLGHFESRWVHGKKATWWHAALPDTQCSCDRAANDPVGEVVEETGTHDPVGPLVGTNDPVGAVVASSTNDPANNPTNDPTNGPEGSQPIDHNNPLTYRPAPSPTTDGWPNEPPDETPAPPDSLIDEPPPVEVEPCPLPDVTANGLAACRAAIRAPKPIDAKETP